MKCFNHPDIDAVGLCKQCNKGLCVDCITDLGDGIACKNLHEDEVNEIIALVKRNAMVSQASPNNIWIMPAFYLFLGFIFVGLGLFRESNLFSFPMILGSGFIFFGIFIYIRYKSIYKTKKKV